MYMIMQSFSTKYKLLLKMSFSLDLDRRRFTETYFWRPVVVFVSWEWWAIVVLMIRQVSGRCRRHCVWWVNHLKTTHCCPCQLQQQTDIHRIHDACFATLPLWWSMYTVQYVATDASRLACCLLPAAEAQTDRHLQHLACTRRGQCAAHNKHITLSLYVITAALSHSHAMLI